MRETYSQVVVDYLLTGEEPTGGEDAFWEIFALSGDNEAMRAAWDELREELLAGFIRDNPGRRPWAWWKFDAPKANAPAVPEYHLSEMVEPRRRIGGTGAPPWEKYPAILPYYTRGIPDSWNGIDEADPPSFESEASYLKRHRLFLIGEEKRIPANGWKPELVPMRREPCPLGAEK